MKNNILGAGENSKATVYVVIRGKRKSERRLYVTRAEGGGESFDDFIDPRKNKEK